MFRFAGFFKRNYNKITGLSSLLQSSTLPDLFHFIQGDEVSMFGDRPDMTDQIPFLPF